jgi:MHS family proline/betaine transporter-like MFS transporter
MTTQSAVVSPADDVQVARKAAIGGAVGNFVEWFDFGVYGYMAPIIATLFFPPGDRTAALLGTFAVFAVAFFMRPVGGFVFGHFGDKVGRRNTLAVAILLMAGATFAIGILPTYAAIGVAAPALLVLCRLAQGFAVGGEYMGAASFVVEYAPERRRGFYASFVSASLFAGSLCGVVLATVLTVTLGEAAMGSWGWRIPFLLGLPLGLIGLYLRLRLEDTPAFREIARRDAVAEAPIKEAFRTQRRSMAVFFGFVIANVVGGTMLIAFMPTYLGEVAGLDRQTVLLSNSITLLLLVVLCPLSGLLADRLGRKPMILAASVGFVVLSLPAFLLAGQGGLFPAIASQVLLAIPIFFVCAAQPVVLVEMFPTRVRYSSGAVIYGLVNMVFGGTAPLVGTALIARSGNALAPGYYLLALGIVSALVAAFAFRETYGNRLVRREDVGAMEVADARE